MPTNKPTPADVLCAALLHLCISSESAPRALLKKKMMKWHAINEPSHQPAKTTIEPIKSFISPLPRKICIGCVHLWLDSEQESCTEGGIQSRTGNQRRRGFFSCDRESKVRSCPMNSLTI